MSKEKICSFLKYRLVEGKVLFTHAVGHLSFISELRSNLIETRFRLWEKLTRDCHSDLCKHTVF